MEVNSAPAQSARRIQGSVSFLQQLLSVPMAARRRASAGLSLLVLIAASPAHAAAPTASNVAITPGSVDVGQTLSGTYSFADADLDAEGVSTFRWLRDGSPIGGATTQQYTLRNVDLGAMISFQVTPVAATAADALFEGIAVASPAVGPVVPANTAPTAAPAVITGTAEAGLTLIGSYNYQDADGDLQGTSTFRWLRNGVAIPGAITTSYLLGVADIGTSIRFEVTPVALTGVLAGSPTLSSAVGPVLAANTAPTAAPAVISGTAEAGFALTGSYNYQDADGDLQGTSTFRWLRNGAAIPGANTTSYLLVAADIGNQITFEVTPVALTGVLVGSPVQSAPVGPVLAANTAPTATNVAISGIPSIGETLTGSYTYGDADNDLESGSTYRWLRDGVATGAATTSYIVTVADVGTTLTFEVTPRAATGVSPGLPAVSGGVLISDTAPTITGQVDPNLSTPEETSITILVSHLTIVDPDSSAFTLTVGDGDNYTHVGPIVTPVAEFNEVLSIPVTVNDGTSESGIFNLQVAVTPVNDQPVIIAPFEFSTPEDTDLTFEIGTNVNVLDPDSTVLTLLLNPGLNYTLIGNVLTPDLNFTGNLTVVATVTDDSGAPNAESLPVNFTVEVTAVNDPAEILVPLADQDAVEGTPFTFDISANFTDPDGDPLTFAIGVNELPPSISFDPATGIFSGTPAQADARDNDPYIINVSASDNQPGTIPAVDQFNLNVSALDRANVSLSIGATPDPAMLNDELRWTFTVRNAPNLQSAVSVELNGSFIGTGLTVTSASACAIQLPAGQVTNFSCTVGSLPPGGSTSIVLTTSTTQVGDVTAFAIAAGSLPVPIDPNIADNSAQLAIGVAQSFSNGPVQDLGNSNVLSVAAGDLNGDGAADLVVGTAAGQPVQVYLSNGFRRFTAASPVPDSAGANEGIALADFNGDQVLDLVVANGGGAADRVYRNTGSGEFTSMATLGATFSQDVAVGDFNNDNNMDIVFAAVGGNPVYRGNGNGSFTLQTTLGNANSHAVAVGRLDGGANVDDIVFANTGSESRVWVYSGGANWFTSRALLAIGDAVSVTTGEFSGDTSTDLAFARVPAAIGDVPANPVLINNGNGTFSPAAILLGAAPTNDIFAGNVNNIDGANRDDLVFINSSGVHQIWVANGSGFVLHSEQIADRGSKVGVLAELGMTDVGDPGGFDLAMGGALQSGVGVFLNDGFGNLGKGDAVAPVLTLKGNASVDTPSGSNYVDSGATAIDNIDGNISGAIAVTSTVNTSVVGTYTVTYKVSDTAGNVATPITRTVNVRPSAGSGGGGGGSMSYWAIIFMLGVLAVGFQRRPKLQIARRQSRMRNKRK